MYSGSERACWFLWRMSYLLVPQVTATVFFVMDALLYASLTWALKSVTLFTAHDLNSNTAYSATSYQAT